MTEVSESGGDAFYIKTNGFDDLMYQISQQCLPEEVKNKIEDIVGEEIKKPEHVDFQLKIISPIYG